MLELIVVFTLAVIGVVFTSWSGEEESAEAARAAARDDARQRDDGVGVFGLDVAAKKRGRALLGLGRRPKPQAPSAMEDEPLPDSLGWQTDRLRPAAPEPRSRRDKLLGDIWDEAETLGEDDRLGPIRGRAYCAEPDAVALPPVSENVPVIEDFDPDHDRLVIEYRPEDAGNGRIGIVSDPDHPGAARVTLGGRCIALVMGGMGQVQARHIELVLEEPEPVRQAEVAALDLPPRDDLQARRARRRRRAA